MLSSPVLSQANVSVEFHGEDPPMTFQVGMLGSNGIVLAGDTLWSASPFQGGYLVRNTYGSGKIRVSETKRIAIACAGHADRQCGRRRLLSLPWRIRSASI